MFANVVGGAFPAAVCAFPFLELSFRVELSETVRAVRPETRPRLPPN